MKTLVMLDLGSYDSSYVSQVWLEKILLLKVKCIYILCGLKKASFRLFRQANPVGLLHFTVLLSSQSYLFKVRMASLIVSLSLILENRSKTKTKTVKYTQLTSVWVKLTGSRIRRHAASTFIPLPVSLMMHLASDAYLPLLGSFSKDLRTPSLFWQWKIANVSARWKIEYCDITTCPFEASPEPNCKLIVCDYCHVCRRSVADLLKTPTPTFPSPRWPHRVRTLGHLGQKRGVL